MPVELTNFTVWGRQWFPDGWEGLRRFCVENGLGGIELLASGATLESAPPPDLVRGVHLRSLGSWMRLAGVEVPDFGAGSNRYATCNSYAQLVATRAEELRQVAVFEPDYVVWHGVYAPFPLLIGGRPRVAPGQFLEQLARLVRAVCEQFRPSFKILFENAFGVGVGPEALDETAAFQHQLSDLPVGLVLDIGHHLNAHREISTAADACEELHRLALKLGGHGLATDVLHLHWTPPNLVPATVTEEAMRDFAALLSSQGADTPNATERTAVASTFFEQSDRHLPLDDPHLGEAVRALAPGFVVHEIGAMSLADHEAWLVRQAAALRSPGLSTGRSPGMSTGRGTI